MRSLNARVALSAGAVLAVFIALAAFALEQAFSDSARSARQERLLAQVYLLMAAAEVSADGHVSLSNAPLDARLDMPGSGLYAAITDAKGQIVWRSRSALSVNAPYGARIHPGTQKFEQITDADSHAYFLQSFGVTWSVGARSYPLTFSVAEDLKPFEQQISIYRHTLWAWLGVTAVLLLIALWLTLRWGLSPLRRVADELHKLEHGEQEQITGDYPSELKGLTDNLNTLLVHERAQQKRYRDALADLAHSLKTPLALVRGTLNSARVERELAHALEEQIERMDRIVGYQLQRAAASTRSRIGTPQPLHAAVERVLAALTKVYAAKPIRTELDVAADLRFRGDESDLLEMLGNVLDNACKWCATRVRVSATLREGSLALCVEDDGRGIDPADAQRVLERGTRADQSVPGHGIGLAVTRDIIEAYGGRIEIGHSPLGGAAVILVLPGV
jgi:two-component system, OmpR family, sensor histidine kinase PhoQ